MLGQGGQVKQIVKRERGSMGKVRNGTQGGKNLTGGGKPQQKGGKAQKYRKGEGLGGTKGGLAR